MADRDGNFIPMILTQNELKLINESKLMSPIGWQNNSRRDDDYPYHDTTGEKRVLSLREIRLYTTEANWKPEYGWKN